MGTGELIGFIGLLGDGIGHPAAAARFTVERGNKDDRFMRFIASFLCWFLDGLGGRSTLQFVDGYINHDEAGLLAGTHSEDSSLFFFARWENRPTRLKPSQAACVKRHG